MKKETTKKKNFKNMRTSRKEHALVLIKSIRAKVNGLKHGYLADEEFDELEKLIPKF